MLVCDSVTCRGSEAWHALVFVALDIIIIIFLLQTLAFVELALWSKHSHLHSSAFFRQFICCYLKTTMDELALLLFFVPICYSNDCAFTDDPYSELGLVSSVGMTSQTRKYFRRMVMFRHMDFEYALWQMLYLCVAPNRVFVAIVFLDASSSSVFQISQRQLSQKYYETNFRISFNFLFAETKNQWARDDPAFLVLLSLFLACLSL